MIQRWRATGTLVWALAALGLWACGGVVGGPGGDGERSATSALVLEGQVSPKASWKTHALEVTQTCVLRLRLDWNNPGANLNLFLYDPSGTLVAHANGTTERPEQLELDPAPAGSYKVAVKAKSGKAHYSITVEQEPKEQLFQGQLSQSHSWTTHQLELSAAGTLTAELAWDDPAANLNLFLYDPSGTVVAHANGTTEQPERVTYAIPAAGSWRLGIKCKSGAAAYTLRVTLDQAGAGEPNPSPEPPPTPTPPPPATPSYPGQPAVGQLYWGAAVSGNGDPGPRHEIPSGHPLSVRRTFFQWAKASSSMVTMANNDLAAGRLPWVSTKTPPWAEMAAGEHDAEIDAMLKALDALPGPVWLTVHHEPEGGGGVNAPDDPAGPAGHLAMNRRVRQRMTALGVDNVSLVLILMSYTWNPVSKRDPEQWWEPGVYDLLGVDHYEYKEASLLDDVWADIRTWAAGKGVDLAVGEWGMRGTDQAAGQRVLEWYEMAANSHSDGKGARVVALSAFDSGLNSPSGSWELIGAQLTMFQQLLGDPRTASVLDL